MKEPQNNGSGGGGGSSRPPLLQEPRGFGMNAAPFSKFAFLLGPLSLPSPPLPSPSVPPPLSSLPFYGLGPRSLGFLELGRETLALLGRDCRGLGWRQGTAVDREGHRKRGRAGEEVGMLDRGSGYSHGRDNQERFLNSA